MSEKKVLAACLLGAVVLAMTWAQAPQANPRVLLSTSMGDIMIELYADGAPGTVKNFLAYVDEKFYDGTIFHRVIPGFMIQAGGHTADMSEKPGRDPIKNEAANRLKNSRGTLAMARTAEDVHSATSQFFINLADNHSLNHRNRTIEGYGYCVFGNVVSGMDVVDAIAAVKTGTRRGHQDVPREPIVITSARRAE